jgi:hypothetical protein
VGGPHVYLESQEILCCCRGLRDFEAVVGVLLD